MKRNNIDPYLYKGCDVLVNKLGTKSAEILEKFERDIVPGRILALKRTPFKIYSVFDVLKIHEYLQHN